MGEIAAIVAHRRHAAVEHRSAADQRLGVAPRFLDEGRDIPKGMLSVGIDLQTVAVTTLPGLRETGQHRRALAAVDRQPQQPRVRHAGGDAIQFPGAGRTGAIIDQHTRQPGGPHRVHDPRDGMFVIEHGNDGAGVETGSRQGSVSAVLPTLWHFDALPKPQLRRIGATSGVLLRKSAEKFSIKTIASLCQLP